jgi:hypothetical protein
VLRIQSGPRDTLGRNPDNLQDNVAAPATLDGRVEVLHPLTVDTIDDGSGSRLPLPEVA